MPALTGKLFFSFLISCRVWTKDGIQRVTGSCFKSEEVCMKWLIGCSLALALCAAAAEPPKKEAAPSGPVSYFKQIRPIFQANCQGCHQPAKAKGQYVMTDFEKLLGKGESGEQCIVPKAPEKSLLVKQITPEKGEAEMPKGKTPLLENEIELVRRW